eukprot:266267-Amphidinium_carterae.1
MVDQSGNYSCSRHWCFGVHDGVGVLSKSLLQLCVDPSRYGCLGFERSLWLVKRSNALTLRTSMRW